MTAVAIIPRGHRHPARVSQFLQHIVSWPASKSQGGGVAGLHGGPDLYGPFDAQPPSLGATGSAPRAPALHEEQPQSEEKPQGFHRPTGTGRKGGPLLKSGCPKPPAGDDNRPPSFSNGPHMDPWARRGAVQHCALVPGGSLAKQRLAAKQALARVFTADRCVHRA